MAQIRILLAVGLVVFMGACSNAKDTGGASGTACDLYVEALCTCNPAMCADAQATYENASTDQQDVCSEKLDDARSGADDACDSGDD